MGGALRHRCKPVCIGLFVAFVPGVRNSLPFEEGPAGRSVEASEDPPGYARRGRQLKVAAGAAADDAGAARARRARARPAARARAAAGGVEGGT